jgi:hypothetical protein
MDAAAAAATADAVSDGADDALKHEFGGAGSTWTHRDIIQKTMVSRPQQTSLQLERSNQQHHVLAQSTQMMLFDRC